MSHPACPSEISLLGSVHAPSGDDSLDEHVGGCSTCRERLRELELLRTTLHDVAGMETWAASHSEAAEDGHLAGLLLEMQDDSSEFHEEQGTPQQSQKVPERVDRYEIQRELDSGGQGRVFLGWDPMLQRQVAIKFAHRTPEGPGGASLQLSEEGMLLAQINHPGLAQVYDCGCHDSSPYLVLEYVEGVTLAEHVRGKNLTEQETRRIIGEVALAVAAAHQFGILHLDLKPENVMITSTGRCKVIDFGMGTLLSTIAVNSLVLAAGTPEFMSPEQRTGNVASWSAASDVFGLGALACWMLTRQAPCPEEWVDEGELRDCLRQCREFLARNCHDKHLAAVCARALAFDPRQRFPDAAAFSATLHGLSRRRLRGILCVAAGLLSVLAAWLVQGEGVPDFSSKISGSALQSMERTLDAGKRHLHLQVQADTILQPTVLVWTPSLGLIPLQGMQSRADSLGTVWEPRCRQSSIEISSPDTLWVACCLPPGTCQDGLQTVLQQFHVKSGGWPIATSLSWEQLPGETHLWPREILPAVRADLDWLAGELKQLDVPVHFALSCEPRERQNDVRFALVLPATPRGQPHRERASMLECEGRINPAAEREQ